MMRVSDFTITVAFEPGAFQVVQGVTFEDLELAFDEAVEKAGRGPGEGEVLGAKAHMFVVASVIRNHTWGGVLKTEDAQSALEVALKSLGIEPPPAAPPRPLN